MKNVELVLGCVMGCELDSTRIEHVSIDAEPIVVLEYCPADDVKPEPNISDRMRDLAAMGFQPVAIVKCDPYEPRRQSLWAAEGLSEAMHFELAAEGESNLCDGIEPFCRKAQ